MSGDFPRFARGLGALLALLAAYGCKGSPQPSVEPGATQPEVKPQPLARLELGNPSDFARPQSPLYLSYYDLGLAAGEEAQPIGARVGDVALATQAVDSDGDGKKDGVFTLVDLPPGGSKELTIALDPKAVAAKSPKLTHAEIAHKVGGEWKPREKDPKLQEYVGGTFTNVMALSPPPQHTDHSNFIRYEGPGIESDKVGYRIYLDERNGFDIFGKKVATPVLQNVGLDGFESYHHMQDWGMDILKVGLSLGAGGFGIWNGKNVELVSKLGGWQATINDDGDLYSSFRIKYKGWHPDALKSANAEAPALDLDAVFSMVGGSRLVHTQLTSSVPLPNIAVGIVKHPGTELVQGSPEVTEKAYTYVGSWGKQSLSGEEDLLGMAVIFQKGARRSQEDDGVNYVSVLEPAGKGVDYYFLAAWAGEPGGVKTKEEFVSYLEQEVEKLTLAPRQRLKTTRSEQSKTFPLTAASALDWAKKLADSELARKTLAYHYGGWDENRGRKPKFEYDIVGLVPFAYSELNAVAPDPKYASVMERVTASYITDEGEIRTVSEDDYNMDSVMPGRALLRLYASTKQEKFRTAAARLRHQLEKHPRTSEGAFWHKKRYPGQLWADGVYMGMPFLAEYSALFEQSKGLGDVLTEFELTRKYLRNEATGLYLHAWDEKKAQNWADPATGLSKHYWARGLGWFAMAVVDVLDYVPASDEKHRKPLLEIITELAPALVKYQDATGTWWQIMDKPDAPGNYRESSASAMFSYFFSKAVRLGYLPATYRHTAIKSFEGMIREFVTVHADQKISMTNQCLVGGLGYGRDGSYRYYMSEPVWSNDPKGTGPFILAGVETYRMLESKN